MPFLRAKFELVTVAALIAGPLYSRTCDQYSHTGFLRKKGFIVTASSLIDSSVSGEPSEPPLLLQMSKDVENPKAGEIQKSPDAPSASSEIQATWYSSLLQQASVYGVAAGYCLSASLLSIINKWAVMKFPYPGALTALQYFTSAVGVFLCGQLKIIEHDLLDFLTMWRFLPAAFLFYLSLFTIEGTDPESLSYTWTNRAEE